jgi:hypothetical protein
MLCYNQYKTVYRKEIYGTKSYLGSLPRWSSVCFRRLSVQRNQQAEKGSFRAKKSSRNKEK